MSREAHVRIRTGLVLQISEVTLSLARRVAVTVYVYSGKVGTGGISFLESKYPGSSPAIFPLDGGVYKCCLCSRLLFIGIIGILRMYYKLYQVS